MTENLFKDSNCPIEAVPKADFNFIALDVCKIPPAPKPIYGCTSPIIVPDAPDDVGPNCPIFFTAATLNIGYDTDGSGTTCLGPAAAILTLEKKDVDPCAYDLALDLTIPIPKPPCAPNVVIGGFNFAAAYDRCPLPPSSFILEKTVTPGDCDTPDTCNFVMALDINVPIPTPACPKFTVTQFSVFSGYAASGDQPGCANGESYFRLTPNITPGDCQTPDQCDFDIAAAIVVPIPRPPCPQINLNSFNVASGYSRDDCLADAANLFSITTNHIAGDGCNIPDQCIFDVDLAIAIPIPAPPCPAINVNTFDVSVALAGREYDNDGNPIDIKCFVEPVSKLSIPYTEQAYTLRVLWYCQDDQTQNQWDSATGLSCPCASEEDEIDGFLLNPPDCGQTSTTYAFYNGAVGDPASGTGVITGTVVSGVTYPPGTDPFNKGGWAAPGGQFEELTGAAVPYVTVSAPITAYNGTEIMLGDIPTEVTGAKSKQSEFTITPRITYGSCNTPDQCDFDIDLTISVPIPRTLCPTIYVGTFDVLTAYADEACFLGSEPKFTITAQPVLGDCGVQDQCEFVLDLEIAVPIPRPACPVINTKTFDVTVGLVTANEPNSGCLLDKKTRFAITSTVIPGDCTTSDSCQFDVELELAIPIPKQPCPNININTFDVVSGYSGSSCFTDFNPGFAVTPRIIPGDCQTPDQCEFDIDLAIAVPIPRTPCPIIDVQALGLTVGFTGGAKDGTCFTGKNVFNITTEHTGTDNCDDPGECRFNVALDLEIPIPRQPCPNLNVINVDVRSGYNSKTTTGENCFTNFTSGLSVTPRITPGSCDTPDQCDFDIDLKIAVPITLPPCPIIDVQAVSMTVGFTGGGGTTCAEGENALRITPAHVPSENCNDPGQCQFNVELDLNVPIPRIPCPQLNLKTFTVTTGYESCESVANKQNYFALTPNHIPGENCDDPGTCEFDIELELAIPIPKPPCPVIRRGIFSQKVFYNTACSTQPDASTFNITDTSTLDDCGADNCQFDIDLELNIPIPSPPCPAINVNTFEVNSGYTGSACVSGKASTFNITSREVPVDCGAPKCEFDIDLEIVVPIPEPPCVTINDGTVKVTTGFAGASCVNGKKSRLLVKKTVTPSASCDVPDTCEFDLDLELVIPIPRPRCPTMSTSGTFASRYADAPQLRGGSFLSITPVTSSPTCNDPGQCLYHFDINVDIPIPRPPCPVITVGAKDVRVSYGSGSNLIFDVLPIHKTNAGTNEPPECAFDIAFDLDLKIPVPPCTIWSGSVNVTPLPVGSTPTGNFSITPQYFPGQSCSVDVALNLGIPQSCAPVIVAKTGTVIAGSKLENNATLFVAQTKQCKFEITPYISVQAITACPLFGPTAFNIDQGTQPEPYGTYNPLDSGHISIVAGGPGDADCIYKIAIDTKTNALAGGTVTVRGGSQQIGSGEVSIANNKINVEIRLDTTDCPAEGGGGSGSKGDQGDPGVKGDTGKTGASGPMGPTGARGLMGMPGAMGMIGPEGPQGETGDPGPAGPTGPKGEKGSTGPQGPFGLQGATGETGATGCVGPSGEIGVTGTAGPIGERGPAGVQGPVGPRGVQGPTGPQGLIGATGLVGNTGATGVGITGATGPRGRTGIAGPVGQRGATGLTGETGVVGATGVPGATGLNGATGVGIQGATGDKGSTGANGATGPRGFTGSKGDRGSTGPAGIPGLRGATGAIGANGATGPIGATGVTGPTGAQGSAGATGASGVTGPRGATGVRGLRGDKGTIGARGPKGATGPRGFMGLEGLRGATGATGPGGDLGPRGRDAGYAAALYPQGTWNDYLVFGNMEIVDKLLIDGVPKETISLTKIEESYRYGPFSRAGAVITITEESLRYRATALDGRMTVNPVIWCGACCRPCPAPPVTEELILAQQRPAEPGDTFLYFYDTQPFGATCRRCILLPAEPPRVGWINIGNVGFPVDGNECTELPAETIRERYEAFYVNRYSPEIYATYPTTLIENNRTVVSTDPRAGQRIYPTVHSWFVATGRTPPNQLALVNKGVATDLPTRLKSIQGAFWIEKPTLFAYVWSPSTRTTVAAGTVTEVQFSWWQQFDTILDGRQIGPTGPAGCQGPIGNDGAPGDRGDTGATGVRGATGPRGITGATGVTGQRGATGVIGITGATGPCGTAGEIGATGVAGVAGATGALGPRGTAGATGLRGITGPTGARGETGPTGLRGATGPQVTLSGSNFISSRPNIITGNVTIVDNTVVGATVSLNTQNLAADANFTNALITQLGLNSSGQPVNPTLRAKFHALLLELLG